MKKMSSEDKKIRQITPVMKCSACGKNLVDDYDPENENPHLGWIWWQTTITRIEETKTVVKYGLHCRKCHVGWRGPYDNYLEWHTGIKALPGYIGIVHDYNWDNEGGIWLDKLFCQLSLLPTSRISNSLQIEISDIVGSE